MKRLIYFFLFALIAASPVYAQVGIGTLSPRGALEISSGPDKNLGFVLPQVNKLEDVINPTPHALPPPDGTMVFDALRNGIGIRIPGGWRIVGGNLLDEVILDNAGAGPTYVKASNTDELNDFGFSVSLSQDGNILAVGAPGQSSPGFEAGAVYVFVRSNSTWAQQAYLKASNADPSDRFGTSVSLSADGKTLAVGATGEASNKNSGPDDNTARAAGAVYVFTRDGSSWTEQAFLKASNADPYDLFGISVSLSSNGGVLAVGAPSEASMGTGTNGDLVDQANDGAIQAGAVYLFTRSGNNWTQKAYIKASQIRYDSRFGSCVSLNENGLTLAVLAPNEYSRGHGINGDETAPSGEPYTWSRNGAVYVFEHDGDNWQQQAFIKPPAVSTGGFNSSHSISLSADGNTLAVGTSSNLLGANIYERSGTTWRLNAQIHPLELPAIHAVQGVYGYAAAVSLSSDGNLLAAGGKGGAVMFKRDAGTGRWSHVTALKFTRPGEILRNHRYQSRHNVCLSGDGKVLVRGNPEDNSNATGINGDHTDESAPLAGAAWVHEF